MEHTEENKIVKTYVGTLMLARHYGDYIWDTNDRTSNVIRPTEQGELVLVVDVTVSGQVKIIAADGTIGWLDHAYYKLEHA